MLVSKLRGARERKRATGVKVEGRKSHQEKRPEAVALARELHRQRLSYRKIAVRTVCARLRHQAREPFSATSIKNMLES
jgi:hypothetical protein